LKRALEDERIKLQKQLEKEKKQLSKPLQTQRSKEKTQSMHLSPAVNVTKHSTPTTSSSERLENPSELDVEAYTNGEVDIQRDSLSSVPVNNPWSNDSTIVSGME